MGVKYVKDFDFPASAGFRDSAMPAKARASERGMPAAAKKGVAKLAKGGAPYYSGGPQSRVPTGPTSPRVTYIWNPFGSPFRVPIGVGAPHPRVQTKNQYTWAGEENPNYNRALAEYEEELRRQQPTEKARGGKVGKVMREYKAGKLHSGSKKGPVVKNQKQAVAIAMSEARRAGEKMPVRKAAGGQMTPQERRALEKMRHAEKYAPGLSLDMPGKRVRKK